MPICTPAVASTVAPASCWRAPHGTTQSVPPAQETSIVPSVNPPDLSHLNVFALGYLQNHLDKLLPTAVRFPCKIPRPSNLSQIPYESAPRANLVASHAMWDSQFWLSSLPWNRRSPLTPLE